MTRSKEIEDTLRRFYDRLSAKDVGSFDELVSADPATLVIGTAPGELVSERAQLRFGFETEGITLQPDKPVGYSEGSVGWAVDRPLFGFPDGSQIKVRLTAIFRKEEDKWKLVHAHFSVGVPDEEVAELQKKWTK